MSGVRISLPAQNRPASHSATPLPSPRVASFPATRSTRGYGSFLIYRVSRALNRLIRCLSRLGRLQIQLWLVGEETNKYISRGCLLSGFPAPLRSAGQVWQNGNTCHAASYPVVAFFVVGTQTGALVWMSGARVAVMQTSKYWGG